MVLAISHTNSLNFVTSVKGDNSHKGKGLSVHGSLDFEVKSSNPSWGHCVMFGTRHLYFPQ